MPVIGTTRLRNGLWMVIARTFKHYVYSIVLYGASAKLIKPKTSTVIDSDWLNHPYNFAAGLIHCRNDPSRRKRYWPASASAKTNFCTRIGFNTFLLPFRPGRPGSWIKHFHVKCGRFFFHHWAIRRPRHFPLFFYEPVCRSANTLGWVEKFTIQLFAGGATDVRRYGHPLLMDDQHKQIQGPKFVRRV